MISYTWFWKFDFSPFKFDLKPTEINGEVNVVKQAFGEAPVLRLTT